MNLQNARLILCRDNMSYKGKNFAVVELQGKLSRTWWQLQKNIPEKSLKSREGIVERHDFERIEEVHFLKYFSLLFNRNTSHFAIIISNRHIL